MNGRVQEQVGYPTFQNRPKPIESNRFPDYDVFLLLVARSARKYQPHQGREDAHCKKAVTI
jgi:hypothetical protein